MVEEETTMEKRMELVEKHVGLVEKQTRQLERRIEPLEKQATIIGTPVNFFPERRQETDKTPKPPSPQLPLFLYGVSEYR